jgi:ketol-acid reductoisomerase
LCDLFAEQAIWPTIIATFREAYSTLKALGCSDEALTHELWMSKEPAEVFNKAAEDGFIRQLVHHSMVSQYGQLKGSMEVNTDWMRQEFKRVGEQRILGGEFAAEFEALDKDGEGG